MFPVLHLSTPTLGFKLPSSLFLLALLVSYVLAIMQEKRKHWQPLAICHRFFTFIMNSLIARSLAKHIERTSHHPNPQGSSNGVVSMEDQQPLVPKKPNAVESIYLQQAPLTPKQNSGVDIQVHYKQTDDDDSKMRNATYSHKLSSSKSIQDVKPTFRSVSQAKDPKRSLSIADVAGLEKEKEKDNKKKGIMLMSNENFAVEMAGEEEERSKLPSRRSRPLFYVAPNINEKSDEFIRSRKEAMRRSQTLA